jgi:pyruvate dehydrogenase phosphatase
VDLNFKTLGTRTPTDDQVIAVLNKSFDEVVGRPHQEHAYREVARQAYDLGFPGLSKVGSCALLALVINDRLFVANAGDCKGVLFRTLSSTGDDGGKLTAVKLNNKLNACSKAEQERLKREFPDDDIFVCKKGNPNACYVKVC